jgi:peroxiredoxin
MITESTKLVSGDTAPDFTLPAADGQLVTLSHITSNGHRVLLVFLRHLG